MRQMMSDNNLTIVRDYSQVHFFEEAEEPSVKDRSVIEMDYEGEDSLDLNESDEKTSLYRQLTFVNIGE
jgi:hypothetical protein